MDGESVTYWRRKDLVSLTRGLWGAVLILGGLVALVAARLVAS